MEEGLEMLRQYSCSDLENLQTAGEAMAILVSTYLTQPHTLLDSRFEVTTECVRLLEREPQLYEVLKRAHTTQNYDPVVASALIHRRETIFPAGAQKYLDELKPLLVRFINDATPMARWTCDPKLKDPALLAHIESLNLLSPETSEIPLVILKDLGAFVDDPVLFDRVKNLFVLGKKIIIVNTSGSGKTRLLFEGLCHNWGFYFTILNLMVRDLGSRDMAAAIERLSGDPDFTRDIDFSAADADRKTELNHALAERRVCQVLLARLLIFRMFLEIASDAGLTETHKKTWLLLQLEPYLPRLYGDIFRRLTDHLCDYDAQRHISKTLQDVQALLGADSHLFLAMDEAQSVASDVSYLAKTSFPRAFNKEAGRRPLLLNILGTWSKHLSKDCFSCVVAGTDVPVHIFDASEDISDVRWTSDTGSFDDRSLHEGYLRRFIPASYLSTEEGKAFLDRAWLWTRGRHRHTASMMTDLLVWGFQQPHTVLDSFITKATDFQPLDGTKWTEMERSQNWTVPEDVGSLSFQKHLFLAANNRNVRVALRDAVYHYLATGRRHFEFQKDEIGLVSLGLGRFVDKNMSEIVFDEPLPIVGLAKWMTEVPSQSSRQRSYVDNFLSHIQQNPPLTSKAFAACLAFYFSRAFDSKPLLSDIFSFGVPIPAWAMQSASLVELHSNASTVCDSVVVGSDFVGPLATSAQNLEEVMSWLEHLNPEQTPFCIPTHASFPDLLFVLKLEDGTYISVMMRVSSGKSNGPDLLTDLAEGRLFYHEEHDDPSSRQRVMERLNSPPYTRDAATSDNLRQTPTLLCVVAAFENQIDPGCLGEGASQSTQASLCMDTLHHLMTACSVEAFVETIVLNVVKRKRTSPAEDAVAQTDGEGESETERESKRQKLTPVELDQEDEQGRDRTKDADSLAIDAQVEAKVTTTLATDSPRVSKRDHDTSKAESAVVLGSAEAESSKPQTFRSVDSEVVEHVNKKVRRKSKPSPPPSARTLRSQFKKQSPVSVTKAVRGRRRERGSQNC
ncbi:hypothetical protein R3P38DRAFT_2881794 [Favolaschia claudopus]|uniref:Uncharacterized protein n=1 Tax=Favolaschia claudopus TaxID=2862362 RepID=A0AAW0D1N3_9AGAR